MVQVREALRRWLKGDGERRIAAGVGVDRNTAIRYIGAAVEFGVDRGSGEEQLSDELIGRVVERVRPHRSDGRGEGWRRLWAPGGLRLHVQRQGPARDDPRSRHLCFVEHGESVLLYGPVGVGKTHVAQALAHMACRRGFDVSFAKTSLVLSELAGGRLTDPGRCGSDASPDPTFWSSTTSG